MTACFLRRSGRRFPIRTLAVGFGIACLATVATAADQPDPTGTWNWSVKRGSQTREYMLELKLEGDKLTGTLHEQGLKDQAIEDGQYKDGEVSFKLTRGANEKTFIVKYRGKLSQDTITGNIEFERNGKMNKRDWEAKREKKS